MYAQTLSSDSISLIQQKLHDAGVLGGAINGDWSNDSEQALVTFQQALGLQTT